jgi:hypothetical protein
MPKASIELSERASRVVNAVNARDSLRGKSAAIEKIIADYEEQILDDKLRREFNTETPKARIERARRARSIFEVFG